MIPPTNDGWFIRHPGKPEYIVCESFKDAMEKWFEGFNIPRFVTNGEVEEFKVSIDRVTRYMSGS